MRNPRDLILWLTFGLPTLVQGYFLGSFALLFRIAKNPRFEGVFLATDKKRWRRNQTKPIKYTTTLAAWVNYGPYADTETRWHEQEVHGEQYLELNVLGGIISLLSLIGGQSWWDIAWWASSGFIWLGPNYLVAFLKHKDRHTTWTDACYFWTSHEQDAYARTQAEFDGARHRWEKT